MPERPLALLALPLLLSVLWGCDGPGSDPPSPGTPAPAPTPGGEATTQEILVSPSLGKVFDAGARAFDSSGTPLSDEVDTGEDGRARLEIPTTHTGPVIVMLIGRAGATYYDEASGQDEAFPGTESFRAALPSPRATTGVSILTELALRLAEASGDPLDAAAIEVANERIRAALAPEIGDLLTPPTLVDSGTEADGLDDSDAGQLAARLGALARMALNDATPALTMLRQLALDAADGVIDGVDSSGTAIATVYTPASFAADFVRAVQDFADAFGTSALQESAATARASASFPAPAGGGASGGDDSTGDDGAAGGGGDVGDGGSSGGGSDDGPDDIRTPTTIDAALVGTLDRFYIDLSAMNARDPFQNEQSVTLTLGADSSLTVGGRTLTDPFRRDSSFEVIWRDDVSDLEWRFQLPSPDTISTITVHDVSASGAVAVEANQLGRLVEDLVPEGVALLGEFASSFDALVVEACDSAVCPDTTPLGGTVAVELDADGVLTFGAIVLDPSTPGTEILDQRALSSPSLFFSVPTADGVFDVSLYVDEGVAPPESQLRGLRLTKTLGAMDGLTVEVVETRPAYTGFFEDFLSATTPPLELIFVQADASPPFGRFLTSAPPGVPTLCRSFELSAVRAPNTAPGASDHLRPQFAWLSRGTREAAFEQKGSRLTTSAAGERRMSVFSGQQFVLARDHVRVEWGLPQTPSTSEIVLDRIQDVATSRQADIDVACADFVSMGGTLTMDQPGTFTLVVGDVSTFAEIYRRDFEFASAGSVTWEELLPSGLQYELVPTSGELDCTTENGSGTLTMAVANANASCSAPPPE